MPIEFPFVRARKWESDGDRLREWLSYKGVFQTEIAKHLGISDDAVHAMIAGYTRINPERRLKIAAFLGIRADELAASPPVPIGGSGVVRSQSKADAKIIEGIVTTVAIKAWMGVLASPVDEECWFDEDGFHEVPSAFLVGGFQKADMHDVITVAGSSMSPRIASGERVIIYRDSTPRSGTIVLAESPEQSVFLKVLRYANERFFLESINPVVASIPDLSGWKIHGHAVCILGEPGSGSRNIEWAEGKPLKA